MGLDETNLQVLIAAGERDEQRHAKRVLSLLKRGKHWVLVTLLLSNVIVNETLPIVMDSVFGGGWPAVLISTALIVMFGECVLRSLLHLRSCSQRAIGYAVQQTTLENVN
jgi:hypothetical protein